MTSAQRIVKYFAIGFAVFLIVSICSGIVFGGLGILTAGKFIEDNSKVEAICEDSETACLQVNLSVSKLNIKTGESLSVDTKNDKVDIVSDGHKLTVIEKGRNYFGNWGDRDITIYVPAEMQFEIVAISGGVGNINIESLKAKNLEMALGIGATKIENLDVNRAKINTGIGELSVNLASPASEYEIEVKKGIGEVTLNGTKVSNNSTFGDGEKKVNISGGIGAIKINTLHGTLKTPTQ